MKRLLEVVLALNRKETRLTGKKPVDATTYLRPDGLEEERVDSLKNVRYVYASGELEGGQRRPTDPIWSLKVFNIEKSTVNKEKPVLYYLKAWFHQRIASENSFRLFQVAS